MKKSMNDSQRKAMFAHMAGAIDYKALNSDVKTRFAVSPQQMQQFYDPWAMQPQNSFLMLDPSLGIGPMNLTSRKPKVNNTMKNTGKLV